MHLIHYLLFVPPTLLGTFYLGKKLKKELYQKKKTPLYFWGILFFIFLTSTILLSPIMVFLLYTCLFFMIFDFLSFLFQKTKQKKLDLILHKAYLHGITVYIISFCITIFGLYNAMNPITTNISITINKDFSPLKIIMLSDLHLGTGTNQKAIDEIVQKSNAENADLFVMVGDIFDEKTSQELKDYLYQQFSFIHTTYGSYYVEGNHDLLTDKTRESFTSNNITVLEDEFVFIDSKFYLIGRLDKKEERKNLTEIVKNIDTSYPIILLNHRPDDLKAAEQLGIDLQLSGHTHAGQLFPANIVLKHGYDKQKNFHLIVSSGYGNWGIPIRTYGHNELVVISLQKEKDA